MSKSADEAWVDAAVHRQQNGLTHGLIEKIRVAVEATAREIAREEIEKEAEMFADLVLGVIRKKLHSTEQADPPAPSEDSPNWLEGRTKEMAARGFRRVNPPAPSEGKEPTYPCHRCGKLRTKAEGGTVFSVCDSCWDAPSEGSDGEVEPVAYMSRWESGNRVLSLTPFASGSVGLLESIPLYSHETVQRLRRRASEFERMYRNRDGRLEEAKAEIARLRNPGNWKIVRNQAEVIERVEDQFTVRYVGPPESEGESDEAEAKRRWKK